MNALNTLPLFWALLFLVLTVNCSDKWCPCLRDNDTSNQTVHQITVHECEKYKGVLFSEKREYLCECCLILKKYNQNCKQPKNRCFVVRCEDGLFCGEKDVCRAQEVSPPVENPEPKEEVSPNKEGSPSFKGGFLEVLRSVFGCDCSKTQCNDEVTRMECEDHQGLFVDRLSVHNKCQCCDRCYIPRGQHQPCSNYHKRNVRYVCDTGLYCSPFTHMCIEKREIFSQFSKRVKKDKSLTKGGEQIEEEGHPDQLYYLSS